MKILPKTVFPKMDRLTKSAELWWVASVSEPTKVRFVALWGKRPVKSVCSCPAMARENPIECKHIKVVMAKKKMSERKKK